MGVTNDLAPGEPLTFSRSTNLDGEFKFVCGRVGWCPNTWILPLRETERRRFIIMVVPQSIDQPDRKTTSRKKEPAAGGCLLKLPMELVSSSQAASAKCITVALLDRTLFSITLFEPGKFGDLVLTYLSSRPVRRTASSVRGAQIALSAATQVPVGA
jgi:hypothetical protein